MDSRPWGTLRVLELFYYYSHNNSIFIKFTLIQKFKSKTMKKIYVVFTSLLATMLLAAMVTNVSAQRTVNVPTFNPGEPVFLNEVIAADTNADGSRVDSNTTYVLEIDGYYPCIGTIVNTFPLKIEAASTDGIRPRIYPSVGGGLESARLFEPRDDITIMYCSLTGLDDLGQPTKNMFRPKADGLTIHVEDCLIDTDVAAVFRLDGDSLKLVIKNNIITNLVGDYNNGRGIDTRGNAQDSIIVENNTWVNIGSRILRTNDETWNYILFNQNTVVNTGRRVLDIGRVRNAVITNNIWQDCGVIGMDSTDTFGIIWADSVETGEQDILISNNNYSIDTGYTNLIPDTALVVPLFNATAQAFVDAAGTGATMTSVRVAFNSGPATTYNLTSEFYANPDLGVTLPNFDTVGQATWDFGYANSALMTSGTEGQQLGDHRWTAITSVSQLKVESGAIKVFPMPVDDYANISFTLNAASDVEMSIYNIVGAKVASVEYSRYPAGDHTITWNGASDSGKILETGMYILRMQAGKDISTVKILKK
jgi:hypothetical protein